jgi:tetratricopeptide (TPR) repeat protein
MIDSTTDGGKAATPGAASRWMQRGILGVVCVLVIAGYACAARLGGVEWSTLNAANEGYNLLAQGFRAGQLSLKKELPPGFTSLTDPYDPEANRPYQILPYDMRDLSYYGGKLYVYFGVTPAVVLFWPLVAVTGQYVFGRQALTLFCGVGFLASVGLLRALWRRYFAEVSVGVVAACALALGLATGVPAILPHSDIHEVAISCGYMLTMLTLAAIWCAMHESRRRSGWLAAASLAYGLAVGARPNLLFGAVILLVPVVQAWRERRRILSPLLAAIGPMVVIGLGLMTYNFLRFGSPFEFGWRYMLAAVRQVTAQGFHVRYLWFNWRVYLLEPARWRAPFPFVHEVRVTPMPAGYYGVQDAFGVLSNIPLVWLALAVPLAWRGRSAETRSTLRGFLAVPAVLFGITGLTLSLFFCASIRYEVEFLPALVLLAVVGILSLERRLANRPAWRRRVRWGWGVLLGFSVLFNLLVSAEQWAYGGCALGTVLVDGGRVSEGIQELQKALRIKPDYADGEFQLGNALLRAGKMEEAKEHYEQALRLKPDFPKGHNDFGIALVRLGRLPEAIGQYEQALRLQPDFAEAQYNLASALSQAGEVGEAIDHYEQALRIKPDYAEAHNNLGVALKKQGRLQEATDHYEQALRIKPNYTGAHYNLGLALVELGRPQEAIGHYEQALHLKPDFVGAHYNLGIALEKLGRTQEALDQYEEALRLKPDFVEAQRRLDEANGSLGAPSK